MDILVKQGEEAIKRMNMLRILPQCRKAFTEGEVWVSEMTPIVGAMYEVDDELTFKIKEFEDEYDALVYHVLHGYYNIGEMYTFLYVSKHEEEWEMDEKDIKENCTYAYVYNKTYPDCSEIGLVGIENVNGGLRRTF